MHSSNTKLRWLGRLTTGIALHPRKTIVATTLALVCCAALAICCLKFKSDRSDLISPDAEFHKRWLEYCERFRETNELLVLLESRNEQQLSQARNWLFAELSATPQLFTHAMVHSSLAEWREMSEASFTKRLQDLEQQYRLARTLQATSPQMTPLQILIHTAEQEVLLRKQAELKLNAAGETEAQVLNVMPRITNFLEQSLQAIDLSYERYFPQQAAVPDQFWTSYLQNATEKNSAFSRDPALKTAESRTGTDSPAAAHEPVLHEELVSVVPLPVAEAGAEKYGPNLLALEHLLVAGRQRFPETTFGVTGIPQLEHEEMANSQNDMTMSSIVSAAGVVLLLVFGFRGFVLPLVCCVTLVFGMIWTLGFTTVAIGHLNILSMAFAAILVGLGIDFCIHLLSSYQDYRQQGEEAVAALGLASDTVGKGIITAAVTTAVAFLCAGLTDFPGVAELGLIAGGGVLLAALATFLVFPALVILSGRWAERETVAVNRSNSLVSSRNEGYSAPLRKLIAFRPVLTLLVLAGPIGVLSWQAWDWNGQRLDCRVPYDANLLNMQPEHLPAVQTQQKLMAGREGEVLYAVTWYDSREEALQQAERFRHLPSVGRVMELASQDLSEETHSPAEALAFLQQAEQIQPPPEQNIPHNPALIGQQLERVLELLTQSTGINETQLRLQLDHFLDRYASQPFDVQIRILDAVEQDLVRSLWSEIRVRVADLKHDFQQQQQIGEILTSRYVNEAGDWLLQIHPRFDVWDDAGLAEFVSEIRQVDPQVTGTPIQNYEASRQLKNSYLNAALYAALAIVLIVLLDVTTLATIVKTWSLSLLLVAGLVAVRSGGSVAGLEGLDPIQLLMAFVSCVVLFSILIEREECLIGLLALLPPVIGALILLGIMDTFQLQFTPANLIALPLVLGIGIDDGVHVIHDFRRSQGRYFMSGNTWRALVLTSLTSIIGFGSLAIATHRGLSGLGTVVTIGISSCLFASVVILPAILSLLSRQRHKRIEAATEFETGPSETPQILSFPSSAEVDPSAAELSSRHVA